MIAHRSYCVARKTYFRSASVILACSAFNASARRTDEHWMDASWERRWWGGIRMTIREYFPL